MINLKDYIKAKKIENRKRKIKEREEYKDNIIQLGVIVFEAIMHNETYFNLSYTRQNNLIKLTDKLYFEKEMITSWEYRIKMNLLSLWKLKREIKKVKKWKIK